MAFPPVSRRAFLAAGGGLVLAAACGGSDGSPDQGGGADGRADELGVLVFATDVHRSEAPQRFGFALARGQDYASGPTVRLAYGPRIDDEATLGSLSPTVLHDRGLPQGRGIYTTDIVVPEAGVHVGVADVDGTKVPFAFDVKEQADALVAGQPASRAASPTIAAPLGTDPICTRNPPCPLHETSLDVVIGAGKPVALMFATPARCSSRYCGPVLDDLLELEGQYEDRVTFVHVEIFQNLRTIDKVPTLDAWGLPSEPWLYGIDGAGTIVSRLDGAFGADEQEQLVERLVD